MARVPLSGVYLAGELKERIRLAGSAYVYQGGTTTAATVYAGETGTGTLTAPVGYMPSRDVLRGWLEPGEYTISQGGVQQTIDATVGDNYAAVLPADDFLSVYNKPPVDAVPSVSATTTSQTIKFVRIVPDKKITAAQVVLYSGTAAA